MIFRLTLNSRILKILLLIPLFGIAFFLKPSEINAQAICTSPPPPTTDTGKIVFSVDIPSDGIYNIWFRMKAANSINDSFYFQVDDICPILIGDTGIIPFDTWSWVNDRDGNVNTQFHWGFGAGTYAITLIGNEDNVDIDKVLFTKDLDCVPESTSGDNCPVDIIISPTNDPTPTSVITPTSAPAPGTKGIFFNSIKLHGIGTGGDNTNPTLPGTQNPLTILRSFSVELVDTSGTALPAVENVLTYRSATGDFSGFFTLSSSVPIGNYIVKIKSPYYLKKQVIGIISINNDSYTSITEISLITGDIDNNNFINLDDYNLLIDCYSDLLPAKNCPDENKKSAADLSDDGYVNANDYNLFLRELSVLSGD